MTKILKEHESTDWKLINILYPNWKDLSNKKILVIHSFECAYLLAFKNEVTYLTDDAEKYELFNKQVVNNFAFGANDVAYLVKDWNEIDYDNLEMLNESDNMDEGMSDAEIAELLKNDPDVNAEEIQKDSIKEKEDKYVEELETEGTAHEVEQSKIKRKGYTYADAGVEDGDTLIFWSKRIKTWPKKDKNNVYKVLIPNANEKSVVIDGIEYASINKFILTMIPKCAINGRLHLYTKSEFSKPEKKRLSIRELMIEKNYLPGECTKDDEVKQTSKNIFKKVFNLFKK